MTPQEDHPYPGILGERYAFPVPGAESASKAEVTGAGAIGNVPAGHLGHSLSEADPWAIPHSREKLGRGHWGSPGACTVHVLTIPEEELRKGFLTEGMRALGAFMSVTAAPLQGALAAATRPPGPQASQWVIRERRCASSPKWRRGLFSTVLSGNIELLSEPCACSVSQDCFSSKDP